MAAAERSIPLPMITMVIPHAMIPRTEYWRTTLKRFPKERKSPEATLITMISRIRMMSIVCS